MNSLGTVNLHCRLRDNSVFFRLISLRSLVVLQRMYCIFLKVLLLGFSDC